MAYRQIHEVNTNDMGGTYPPGAAPSAGLQPGVPMVYKVVLTAGAGSADDTQVTLQQKGRVIDCTVAVVTGVASSTVQLWTAAAAGGSAASSAISTASAGLIRSNLITATQVFASGATIFVRRAAGASLCGSEVYITVLPEQ
jgi:hypothetical protein